MTLDNLEWAMITVTFVLLIALFFLLIIKPKQYEKIKKKGKGGKDIDVGTDQYDEVINDYPTYTRNQK